MSSVVLLRFLDLGAGTHFLDPGAGTRFLDLGAGTRLDIVV